MEKSLKLNSIRKHPANEKNKTFKRKDFRQTIFSDTLKNILPKKESLFWWTAWFLSLY